jgi:hypothetical protein
MAATADAPKSATNSRRVRKRPIVLSSLSMIALLFGMPV